jgi:hypothetical protein
VSGLREFVGSLAIAFKNHHHICAQCSFRPDLWQASDTDDPGQGVVVKKASPTEAEVRRGLSSDLCRCGN